MGHKHKRLYERVISEESLRAAYHRASTGKRQSYGYLAFNEYPEVNLLRLQMALKDETWEPSPSRMFTIYEPKPRVIGAPTFADRVVHHALCSVIDPIFDATFLPYSFACRKGKGTHAGVKFVQARLRQGFTHFLKTDFRKFFPSIDRSVLHAQVKRKITCKPTLDLFTKIVPAVGQGVPIGALTSQLSANIYGNMLDQYLHHQLRVPFARYMDDVVVFGNNSSYLRDVKVQLEQFAATAMHLEISRWDVAQVSRGVDFLGYRIWPTHKLLRRASVTKAKRAIRTAIEHDDLDRLSAFCAAWKGHAALADSMNLRVWLNDQHDVAAHLRRHRRQQKPDRTEMLMRFLP